MHTTPTTFDDLYDARMSYREAHVAAAVLPHLPDDEALIRIRSAKAAVYDVDEVRWFEKRATPIAPGLEWYRARVSHQSKSPDDVTRFEPVPHALRVYYFDASFVDMLHTTDLPAYDFTDTDQTNVSDFVDGDTPPDTPVDGGDYPRTPRLPI